MTQTSPSKITRRNFLQLLVATGAGALAVGVLRSLNSTQAIEPKARTLIKNIIIFIQENHSFDSLFAGFPGANSQYAGQRCPDALLKDPPHTHSDAFEPDGATTEEARCSYTEADAPNYWKAARTFTLCDNYFADVRGPSFPNFLMMISGQTPILGPGSPAHVCPNFCLDMEVLPNRLDAGGLTWGDYGGIFTSIKSLVGRPEVMDFQDEKFFEDAERGTLPHVAWLNSGYLHDGNAKSGHPPFSLCGGENYAVQVLNAVMSGPQWPNTALFLVWDEWGGFYDHVEPPVAERWSDGTPYRYGHRAPCLVISPYARSGYVSHTFYSHMSLLRFAETIFDLEPLTERDAEANNMLDCFDFDQSPLPPLTLVPRDCPS
ncbi:MAG TPA: alkaline phosphatase family protein [Anaerolineales bacterium]|nr:alkaline phosphatase family protein [Anaerolineales bacterium]